MAGETLGHLLALSLTATNEQDRAQVAELAEQVQRVTGEHVEIAFVDQGYSEEQAAEDAARHGIRLEVVKLPEANRGCVLVPRRSRRRAEFWLDRPALVAWPAITNDYRRHWQNFIFSPSPF